MAFIQFSKVSLAFGDRDILKNVSVNLATGTKAALTGANGAGKSTLIKIMAGLVEPDSGERVAQKDARIAYLPQSGLVHSGSTLKEEADKAFDWGYEIQRRADELGEQLKANPANSDKIALEHSELLAKLEESGWYRREVLAESVLIGLGFERSDFAKRTEEFSGGWQMRIALAKALMCGPDILLLDEPTNHLDAETIAWLERHLRDYKGTIIAITHDRYFLDNVAGWILEMDRGEGYPFKGNYTEWLEAKEKRMALEEKQASQRHREMQEELEWIHAGAKGRQAKHKEHITKYEALLAEESKRVHLKDTQISIPAGPRLGSLVIEAHGLTKSYGDKLLFENLDFAVPAGAVVGIVGPNGAGKTTLFKMLADAYGDKANGEKPDSGSFKIGETVKLVYVDQMRSRLDDNKTVYEMLSDGLDLIKLGAVDEKGKPVNGMLREVNSHAYCSWFNFNGAEQNKKISVLSGGEKNRLNMGMMFKEAGNVLLLDEPTNDLDIATTRSLEEAIQNFAGCVMVISHDRYFLDRICTHILAYENNSEVRWFEGNWSEYVEWKKKELGEDSEIPHKTVYRKLTR